MAVFELQVLPVSVAAQQGHGGTVLTGFHGGAAHHPGTVHCCRFGTQGMAMHTSHLFRIRIRISFHAVSLFGAGIPVNSYCIGVGVRIDCPL